MSIHVFGDYPLWKYALENSPVITFRPNQRDEEVTAASTLFS